MAKAYVRTDAVLVVHIHACCPPSYEPSGSIYIRSNIMAIHSFDDAYRPRLFSNSGNFPR